MRIVDLDTPAIILDKAAIVRNIHRMIEPLNRTGIAHRPHFKTHKSLYLARLQREFGALGMTCAKLGEAETLIDGGFDDIFIAYPIIGEIKVRRLLALSKRAYIRTQINSIEGATAISEAFSAESRAIDAVIEIDGDMGRSGITLANLVPFAKQIAALPGINLIGIMTYRGGIYALDPKDYAAETAKEAETLNTAAALLKENGIAITVLSGGSSFSSKYPKLLSGITEVRAGNYIFNDAAQLTAGLIKEEDCALTILATVVTIVDDSHAIIDAGSKTLSSDTLSRAPGFGRIAGAPPGTVIYKLSEEHGYLQHPPDAKLHIGRRVRVIPNHSCIPPNFADVMYVLDEGEVFAINVDARGKNA